MKSLIGFQRIICDVRARELPLAYRMLQSSIQCLSGQSSDSGSSHEFNTDVIDLKPSTRFKTKNRITMPVKSSHQHYERHSEIRTVHNDGHRTRRHEHADRDYSPGPDLMQMDAFHGGSHDRKRNLDFNNRISDRYNYGLPGKGKSKRARLQSAKAHNINGEVLFGLHPTLLALQQERRVPHRLFVKDSLLESPKDIIQQMLQICQERNVNVDGVSKATLEALSQSRPHQGVCADVSPLCLEHVRKDDFQEILRSPATSNFPAFWLVLEGIQDPMNFGAILRSAYYMGVDRVYATSTKSCALSPVVSKASAGVLEVLPIYGIQVLEPFLQACAGEGWQLLGTTSGAASTQSIPHIGDVEQEDTVEPTLVSSTLNHTSDSLEAEVGDKDAVRMPGVIDVRDAKLEKNTVLILGNEGEGLTDDTKRLCHELVSISAGRELLSGIESLNVSVASGVLLHQLLGNRGAKQSR